MGGRSSIADVAVFTTEDCWVSFSSKMVIKTGASVDNGLLREDDMSDGLKMDRNLKWPER